MWYAWLFRISHEMCTSRPAQALKRTIVEESMGLMRLATKLLV